jgi:hypothetical protein
VWDTQRHGRAPRHWKNSRRRAEGVPRLHTPRSRPAARARNQQLIGKNRQLMSNSGGSATRASLHGHEAEVASVVSEATARCWNHEPGRRHRGPLEAGVSSRPQVSRLALPSSRTVTVSRTAAGRVYGTGGATRPPNKEMKLTSVEHIGRSQLISGVRRTYPGSRETGR